MDNPKTPNPILDLEETFCVHCGLPLSEQEKKELEKTNQGVLCQSCKEHLLH